MGLQRELRLQLHHSASKDEPLENQFIYDFSAEHKITERWSLFGEVFANTSPALGERGTFSGAEATEFQFTPHFNAFVRVGHDTDHLFNVRPGINFEF
jgi:hypothetical protein